MQNWWLKFLQKRVGAKTISITVMDEEIQTWIAVWVFSSAIHELKFISRKYKRHLVQMENKTKIKD